MRKKGKEEKVNGEKEKKEEKEEKKRRRREISTWILEVMPERR